MRRTSTAARSGCSPSGSASTSIRISSTASPSAPAARPSTCAPAATSRPPSATSRPSAAGRESPERLALRYGILTEYTSYLVQEPNVAVNGVIPIEMRPQDQAGAPAVQRAREQAAFRGSVSLDAITVTAAGARADSTLAQQAARGRAIQRVGARVFERRDSVWTDLRH